jgi:hypothetical protein
VALACDASLNNADGREPIQSPEDDAAGRTPLVLGGRLLGEEDRARRIVAAAVMVAGIVLLSVG